ncbi:MAG: aromatic ring hydroxylase [Devosia sp. 67-54]|uniref:metal-sulfur cluster assembly factor n=1 Tax=unclassified Devosia TaxID=196773 RepID=UPI0009658CB8|nr:MULTISPECIES: metal-sulfur cluster assembly factor [unclassified Devosia]MBN9305518.1 metal-sulfur cluster assembly factor [Devosia sp.]OJX19102.1 MAG: aromatic ring hydroxylase [Devosia sp. 67-54]
MSAESDALIERVTEALRVVIDPELGYNIVDLGLVYSITAAEGGVVDIVMTTTTRGCPATGFLKDGARDGAWAVPGVEFVDVTLTYEPHWVPEMMTDAAKQHLGFA